jgi:hypothetical protein
MAERRKIDFMEIASLSLAISFLYNLLPGGISAAGQTPHPNRILGGLWLQSYLLIKEKPTFNGSSNEGIKYGRQ